MAKLRRIVARLDRKLAQCVRRRHDDVLTLIDQVCDLGHCYPCRPAGSCSRCGERPFAVKEPLACRLRLSFCEKVTPGESCARKLALRRFSGRSLMARVLTNCCSDELCVSRIGAARTYLYAFGHSADLQRRIHLETRLNRHLNVLLHAGLEALLCSGQGINAEL